MGVPTSGRQTGRSLLRLLSPENEEVRHRFRLDKPLLGGTVGFMAAHVIGIRQNIIPLPIARRRQSRKS